MSNGHCTEVLNELNKAWEEYNKALLAERSAEMATMGEYASLVPAGQRATACWATLNPFSRGEASESCVEEAYTAAARTVVYNGLANQEAGIESTREEAQYWLKTMQALYCFCIENNGWVGELPEEPTLSDQTDELVPWGEDEDFVYYGKDCCEDE